MASCPSHESLKKINQRFIVVVFESFKATLEADHEFIIVTSPNFSIPMLKKEIMQVSFSIESGSQSKYQGLFLLNTLIQSVPLAWSSAPDIDTTVSQLKWSSSQRHQASPSLSIYLSSLSF